MTGLLFGEVMNACVDEDVHGNNKSHDALIVFMMIDTYIVSVNV